MDYAAVVRRTSLGNDVFLMSAVLWTGLEKGLKVSRKIFTKGENVEGPILLGFLLFLRT